MIRIALAAVFVLHGGIHLLGFVDGFGYASIEQFSQPILPAIGLLWLTAGLLCWAAAAALFVAPRWWWAVGGAAVLTSQVVIATSWSDAKVGTMANLLLLIAVCYGWASRGPRSLRAEYERDLGARWPQPGEELVTESDLAQLPDPVRRYLRRAGVVDQPKVQDFRASWTGRIRRAPNAPWMTFSADQLNTVVPPQRFFLMNARMKGLPVDVLHAFDRNGATMRVRLLSIKSMVNASGAELTRAETVTIFNDFCLYAPSALVDPSISWIPIDSRAAIARFTLGCNTISARLTVNDDGDLVDFVSDDRAIISADGTFIPARWSTPVQDFAQFGAVRVARRAAAQWHPQSGPPWTYGEFRLTSIEYNVAQRAPDPVPKLPVG
jgi:hypothetical protein